MADVRILSQYVGAVNFVFQAHPKCPACPSSLPRVETDTYRQRPCPREVATLEVNTFNPLRRDTQKSLRLVPEDVTMNG
jgi:hypothetical protein